MTAELVTDSGQRQQVAAGSLPSAWLLAEGFKNLQALAFELASLWEETGASDDEQVTDVEAISAAASASAAACLHEWQNRRSVLVSQCQELLAKAKSEGATEEKLLAVVRLPLKQRVAALGKLVEECRKAGIAAALAALGLDPKDLEGLSPEELLAEQKRLEALLRERYAAALRALGLNPDDFPLTGDLASMAAQLKELEAKLQAQKENALANALRARAIWEELQEKPCEPRDNHAVALAQGVGQIDAATAAAVAASREAWEARRAELAAEVNWLHDAIRGHGTHDVVEPFLSAHGSLTAKDRSACRAKLQLLRDECRQAEAPIRQQLRQLYKATGADLEELEPVYEEVEKAKSKAERLARLSRETKRMERYAESVKTILGQREELKALVVAGECFERAAQAGEGRWVGNSMHFLEEEKFRKRFVRQYPELRDKLIDSIEAWEAAEGREFMHDKERLGDRLREMRDQVGVIASAQGDLSVVGILLQLLGVRQKEIPVSPAAKGKRDRSPHRSPKVQRSRSSPLLGAPKAPSSRAEENDGLSPIKRTRSEQAASAFPPILPRKGASNCQSSPQKRRPLRRGHSGSQSHDSTPKLPPIHRSVSLSSV